MSCWLIGEGNRAVTRILGCRFQNAAGYLVELHGLEQRLEVALAEALVAFPLDDLEEDRADGGFGEDLQQQPAARAAIDQDPAPLQLLERLAMVRQALADHLVVGVRRVEQLHARCAQLIDGGINVAAMHGDVLDALAVILLEILLDLRAVVGGFVDRDADLAAGAGHRLGLQASELALDVEVADLAAIEQPFVELGPFLHAAAVDVVREVIDVAQAGARGSRRIAAPERLEARQRPEIHVVDRVAVIVLGIAVDEVDERVADALDRRDAELARPRAAFHAPGAALEEPVVRRRGILHAEGHGAHARAVATSKVLRERARLGVDDEVDVALLVEQHVLVAVPSDRLEAHALEQLAERPGIGHRVLDELEAVGLDRVVPQLGHDRILALKNGDRPHFPGRPAARPALAAHDVATPGRLPNFLDEPDVEGRIQELAIREQAVFDFLVQADIGGVRVVLWDHFVL